MEIDWDYARNADLWEHEEACKYVCPKDAVARAKLDKLARVAAHAKKLNYVRIRRRRPFPDGYAYEPHEFLAFAQSKGFTIRPELAGIASPAPVGASPDDEEPSTTIAPDAAKRKAPVIFIAALIRLLVEISKRAAEKGMSFDPGAMPGTKADFRALAKNYDGELEKAPSTFDDYLTGLLTFKQGARSTAFYRDLFPEFFV